MITVISRQFTCRSTSFIRRTTAHNRTNQTPRNLIRKEYLLNRDTSNDRLFHQGNPTRSVAVNSAKPLVYVLRYIIKV